MTAFEQTFERQVQTLDIQGIRDRDNKDGKTIEINIDNLVWYF